MADLIIRSQWAGVDEKLVDMGDDTYAPMRAVQQAALTDTTDSVNLGRIADTVPPMSSTLGLGVEVKGRVLVGSQSNAFTTAQVTGINATSTVIDCQHCTLITVFGLNNANGNLEVQQSIDASLFFPIAPAATSTIAVVAGTAFGATFEFAARYVRLRYSAAATWTAGATILGKG
jgi:hypothetical protein